MELPRQALHQFTEVHMDLFSDDDYKSLLRISYFAKTNGTTQKYGKLSDALRKYQWFIIAHMRAQTIEQELLKIEVQSYILFDPVAQSEFSKSVYEMIIYGKAALDSLAQFISDFFALNQKPQSCDFKWSSFRMKFEETNIYPDLMNELEYWLSKDSELTSSISSARDLWIHKEYITIPFLWPPKDFGCLVIPKLIEKNNIVDVDYSNNDYYSIDQFVEIHRNNLSRLISSVIYSISVIESDGRTVYFPDEYLENRQSFFPMSMTEGREWSGYVWGPFTSGFNQANAADSKKQCD